MSLEQRPDESNDAWLDRLDRLAGESRGWTRDDSWVVGFWRDGDSVAYFRPTKFVEHNFEFQIWTIAKVGWRVYIEALREAVYDGMTEAEHNNMEAIDDGNADWEYRLATAPPLPRVLAALAALNKENADAN